MKKAIIIGAGPAGLTAAYQLLKETDIKPIIFEASQNVGGISQTVLYKNNRMDLGGHRFFTKNSKVMELWKEMMPLEGAPSKDDLLINRKREFHGTSDPEKEEMVLLERRRISRIFYLRKFFDYPISLKPQTFINLGFFKTFSSGVGYINAKIFKRKENSLADFYINRFGRPLYQLFFEDYTAKVWGRNPKEISPDWGSQRVKGLSLSKAVFSALKKPFSKEKGVETSLIESFYYPKKGPGELYWEMANRIIDMGGEIRFESNVVGLKKKDNHITKIIIDEKGKQKEQVGDYFISTMPLKDLFLGLEEPNEEAYQVASHLPYRDFITVGLLLNQLAIKNKTKIKSYKGLIPDCWIYVQDRDVKLGRIQIFNNWSPYMVNDYENTVWIGLEYFCNEGDSLWEMNDTDFINFAIGELEKINIINSKDVLDSVRIKVKKAYPAYFDSYKDINIVQDYLDTIDNLYCIGRNGMHHYNNMDHSMLTAIEAVSAIKGTTDKSILWKVNAEKEYHEEK